MGEHSSDSDNRDQFIQASTESYTEVLAEARQGEFNPLTLLEDPGDKAELTRAALAVPHLIQMLSLYETRLALAVAAQTAANIYDRDYGGRGELWKPPDA